jgi:ABC-type dipeptide/oligopeptide/nickel transport system permease subunit
MAHRSDVVLSLREQPYVDAAVASGAPDISCGTSCRTRSRQ